jgi:GNAT superfamily N-acetyltransferase
MKIIDLTKEYESFYFQCFIDDPEWLADAGDYKRAWYETMKPRGLKVKMALDDSEEPVGMIQYLPIEESIVAGRNLSFLYCIWVVNNERYRVSHQNKGFGKALLEAFEGDARRSGKKGVAAWGLDVPYFMRADWFAKRGYAAADREGQGVLLWKRFREDAEKPSWVRRRKPPAAAAGSSAVVCFRNGWCPAINTAFTRAKRAIAETGGNIEYREIDTTDPKNAREWGISDALCIGGQEMPLGPAPTYEDILKAVKKIAE